MTNLKYFYYSFLGTFIGLLLCSLFVWLTTHSVVATFNALLVTMILSVLEISLSFDNAVVNAVTLKKMSPKWRHRFLTWGIIIAVFGMRLVFPVLVVSVTSHINPIDAFLLALHEPKRYEQIMVSNHISVSAFGGAFLLMVCFSYFFDAQKEIHWVRTLETKLSTLGRLNSSELSIALLVTFLISRALNPDQQFIYISSAIFGLLTFVAIDIFSTFLQVSAAKVKDIQRASFGMFLYLEVLDASFSFDGVIGAFAITNNILIIMIGLGIGALYVRSLTILLVEQGTLKELRFLEHGAFYAIGALALIMLISAFIHVPEVVTGLLGATLIGLALISSLRHNAKNKPLQGK